MKPIFKRFVSGVTSLVTALSFVPIITTNAEEKACQYPYTMFASSNEDGAITINAGNFGLNGRIATNGTVKATTNVDFVGYADENICAEMIYIPNRINSDFFSSGDVEEFDGDYDRSEVNININVPISVNGNTDLSGNVTIQSGIKSLNDVTITGDVQNSGNTVIYSKYGDIEIVCNNVNINGLIYAPFGNVNIKANNINLNNTMIIANTITIDTSSINANYSERFGRYFGEVSDVMEIPEEDYQYFSDENANNIPDFFENSINWKYLQDSDGDGVPDIIEKNSGTDPDINEEDYNEILDSYTLEMMYKNPLILSDSETSSLFIYGDLSNDLVVDAFDLVLMRKAVVDGRYIEKADLDGDEDLDGDDLKHLSDFLLGKAKSFLVYIKFDSDDDGVSDYIEVEITKTSPHNADTDGDTISDYDEIVYSQTSPITKYTRGLSVTDAADDPDEDNLTNKEEINYGTNPQLADSDLDGINDYDELKIYNTNPNDDDSDDDYISDGDEIKLGLEPVNDKSDGKTLDSERTFEQTISSDNALFSNINTDDAPYTVSIDIVSAGIAEKSISISTGEFANALEDERIKGKSVRFSYDENVKTDSAKIYFTPKETKEIEDYMIFEYFPDTNYLLPVESKYTESSVYTEAYELGTYCLVDISEEKNMENGDIGIFADQIVLDYELGETEVAFFVDISGSLDETALKETKNSIHDFSQALFEHSENSYVTIIGYYLNPISQEIKIVQYKDLEDLSILKTIDSVDNAISKLSPCTTVKNNDLNTPVTLVNAFRNNGLFSSDCKNKYVFILADSTYTMTNGNGYKLTIPTITENYLNYISDDEIHLNYILSKENYSKFDAVKNLKNVCNPLGFGVYSKSATGNFSVKCFERIYSDAIINLDTMPVAFVSSLSAKAIPDKVERNAFINSLPKSYDKTKVPEADADGKIDFKDAAVKVGAAKLENGNLVFPSLYDVCNIFESTRLGYEQYMMNKAISDKLISGAIQIVPFSDKILYEDSDGDGIINMWDASPDAAIDPNFKVINDSESYGIDYLISEAYQKVIAEGKENYKSIEADWNDGLKDELLNYCGSLGGFTIFSRLILHFGEIFDSGIKFGATPHGANALFHYLQGSGEDFLVKLSIPLGLHKTQRTQYYNQLNSFFDMTEQTIKPGHIYSFATTTNPDEKWSINYGNRYAISEQVADDWWLTFGGANNALVAEVSCNEEVDGNMHYTAKIKYYIYDYYDWDDTDEEELANLHKYGKAQNFRTVGGYSFTIEWIEGKRYPIAVNSLYPLSTTEFDGINDGLALKNAYDYGKKYYDDFNCGGVIEWKTTLKKY